MRALTLTVTEIATFAGQWHVRCAGDLTPEPGQFYLAALGGPSFLRQPIFPFHTPETGLGFGLDAGSSLLSLEPGLRLDMLGPCGRGFQLPDRCAHLLVIAPAMHRLLPLIYHALGRQINVTGLIPADTPLPDLPLAVEIVRGPFTVELGAWADVVALDVPNPLAEAEAIRALCPMRSYEFVQALMVPSIPCGTGACQACWVETRAHQRRLACTDGPVFFL